MNRLTFSIAIASGIALLMIGPKRQATAASQAQVRQAGDIPYATGGVSEEGRESLKAIAQEFNVKLVLATRSGAYLSDVGVKVNDEHGHPVLAAKSDGPWFFAKLPSGHYTIEASSNGTVVKKAVNVGARGQSEVDFRWDD